MLIKISDIAYVDFDSILLVDYIDDKVRLILKGKESEWITLAQHISKPFLAEIETWCAIRAKTVLDTIINLEKSL